MAILVIGVTLTVDGIVSGYILRIEVCHGSQPDDTMLTLYKPLLSLKRVI